MSVKSFTARFERTCARCGYRIRPGSKVWVVSDIISNYDLCSRCINGRPHRKRKKNS
jgi:hypothetical protein